MTTAEARKTLLTLLYMNNPSSRIEEASILLHSAWLSGEGSPERDVARWRVVNQSLELLLLAEIGHNAGVGKAGDIVPRANDVQRWRRHCDKKVR